MMLLRTLYYALPSAVTLSALSCGVSAVRSATLGYFEWSVLYLCLAALFDGLDGHVARLLNAVSEMGAELDSLCDLVDFGVAPSLVVYTWLRHQPASDIVPDGAVWASCVIFVCCCAYRLARFNLTDANAPKAIVEAVKAEAGGSLENIGGGDTPGDGASADGVLLPKPVPKKHKESFRRRISRSVMNHVSRTTASKKGMEFIAAYITKKKFFQGVPAPMAGALVLTPMVWTFQYEAVPSYADPHLAVIVVMLLVGALMVSTVPTLSSKMLMRNPRKESHLKSRSALSFVLKMALVGSVLLTALTVPWYLYLVFSVFYIAALPLGPFVHYLSE